MDKLRQTAGTDTVLALDAGDLFPVDETPGRPALLLRLFDRMQYDAVAIGDQELVHGLDAWTAANRAAGMWDETAGHSTFPWLSGGYRMTDAPAGQQILAPPWKIVERAGMRIGIVSVVGEDAWRFARSRPEGMVLMDPERMIAIFQESQSQPLDLTIVLSHQGLDADRKLAARVHGVDLIVGGHSQSLISPPEIVNNVVICQAGKNGENLGILRLTARSVDGDADAMDATPTPSVEPSTHPEETEGDPFRPTVVETAHWRIVQRIVPLTTAIEDDETVAHMIDAYYAERDSRTAERLAQPDPRAEAEHPQLVVGIPDEPVVLAAGERQTVRIRLENRGGAPLTIERVRSRSPWLELLEAPAMIEPGTDAEARFEVIGETIDRWFRCEFSVLSDDPLRRVAQGAFSGRIEGPMPGIIDIDALWTHLVALSGTNPAQADDVDSDHPGKEIKQPQSRTVAPTPSPAPPAQTADDPVPAEQEPPEPTEKAPNQDLGDAAPETATASFPDAENDVNQARETAAAPAAADGSTPEMPNQRILPTTTDSVEPDPVPVMGRNHSDDLDGEPAVEPEPRRVKVEYFHVPGCLDCRDVERYVLPDFTNRFAGMIEFRAYDVRVPAHYLRLARLQERLQVRSNEPVAFYVDETVPILGLTAIRNDLTRVVAARLAEKTAAKDPQTVEKAPSDAPAGSDAVMDAEELTSDTAPGLLSERLRTFTIPTVIVAGLIDGVNPCAFAAIVFFISLLSVSGVKAGRLLLVGAAYTLAVFTTYLLMGFGAFQVLQALQDYQWPALVLRWGMLALLLALAVFSFRDAWKYKRSGRSSDVKLQLPEGLKRRMHTIMRRRLNPANLFVSALVIGVLVTLIEAVCTGQVYLPTLVLLSRYADTRLHAFSLLLLYNLMFVVPLIVVIAAAFAGTRNQRLIEWSKRNVVWGKIAMGTLFVALAGVLLVL